MEAEADVEEKGGCNCATRHSLKHMAFLQVEATLSVHNGSNDRVISMLYNIYVIYNILLYMSINMSNTIYVV